MAKYNIYLGGNKRNVALLWFIWDAGDPADQYKLNMRTHLKTATKHVLPRWSWAHAYVVRSQKGYQ